MSDLNCLKAPHWVANKYLTRRASLSVAQKDQMVQAVPEVKLGSLVPTWVHTRSKDSRRDNCHRSHYQAA